MSAHLISDPATAPTTATADPATERGWHAASAALTDEVPIIADREDLLVTIAPGAGHGAPACYLPPHATIEVDGTTSAASTPPPWRRIWCPIAPATRPRGVCCPGRSGSRR